MEGKQRSLESLCARPPAIPPAAISAPFRALRSQAAPSERRSALIGSFERLRAIGLADPGIFTAASLKLLALGL